MKKIISVMLSLSILLGCITMLASCSTEKKVFDIAFITDMGTVNDKQYNQAVWNGVEKYAEENKLNCRYYQPVSNEKETLSQYVDISANDKVKYIVCQGDIFVDVIKEKANQYKDIKFLLLNVSNDNNVFNYNNVMSVSFNELKSGFIAGYYAVKNGFYKSGFIGKKADYNSNEYGYGYVQGVQFATKELGKSSEDVSVYYGYYDDSKLDFDYSVNIKPVYKKISDDSYKVEVKNGIGSGIYQEGENVTLIASNPEEGKVFDKWVASSKDVNLANTEEMQTNLIVGTQPCEIEATYKPTDEKTYAVTVENSEFKGFFTNGSQVTINAPVAQKGMIFDKWEIQGVKIDDKDLLNKSLTFKVDNSNVSAKAVYKKADVPTFRLNVENSTGSGDYIRDDTIELIADPAPDGKMFDHWESDGKITFENEFSANTSCTMSDRFSALAKSVYNNGTKLIFGGGNDYIDSIYNGASVYGNEENDNQRYVLGFGYDQSIESDRFVASVVNNVSITVQQALNDFKGNTHIVSDNVSLVMSNDLFNSVNEKDAEKLLSDINNGKITLESSSSNKSLNEIVDSNLVKIINL